MIWLYVALGTLILCWDFGPKIDVAGSLALIVLPVLAMTSRRWYWYTPWSFTTFVYDWIVIGISVTGALIVYRQSRQEPLR